MDSDVQDSTNLFTAVNRICHSAAMLSLWRIKKLCFCTASLALNSRLGEARLAVQTQSLLFSRDSTWPPSDKRLSLQCTSKNTNCVWLSGVKRSHLCPVIGRIRPTLSVSVFLWSAGCPRNYD